MTGTMYHKEKQLLPYFKQITSHPKFLAKAKTDKHIDLNFRAITKAYNVSVKELTQPQKKVVAEQKQDATMEFIQNARELNDLNAIGKIVNFFHETEKREVRQLAVATLRTFYDVNGSKFLIRLLKSSWDNELKKGILFTLALVRDKENIKEIYKIFTDKDEPQNVKAQALMTLSILDYNTHKQLIFDSLNDKSNDIAAASAEILVTRISNLSQNDAEKQEIENAFIKLGARSAELFCSIAGRSFNIHLYTNTEPIIKAIGEPALKPLITNLSDKNSKIKYYAIHILGLLESKQAIDQLKKLVNDKDPIISKAATKALGEVSDLSSIDNFIKIFRNKDLDKDKRAEAIISLRKVYDEEKVKPIFLEALKDDYKRIRNCACIGLGTCNVKDAVEPLMEVALNDKEEETRYIAVNNLALIDDNRVYDFVLERVKDKSNIRLRKFALTALGSTKDKRAFEVLKAIFLDKKEKIIIREFAIVALRKLEDKRAIPLLEEHLETENDYNIKKQIKYTIEVINKSNKQTEKKN
jgi:HEAT repeat protein